MPRADRSLSASPLGHRIRARRQSLGLTQAALARQVGISASYMNLIEHDQRSIGGSLLHHLADALDLPPDTLSGREEARLISELREVSADPLFRSAADLSLPPMSLPQASDLVGRQPALARTILSLYRAYRDLHRQSHGLAEQVAQDPFLGDASHQVLSEITAIRSFSEILQDYDDMDDAHRRKFIDALADESTRLTDHAGELFAFLGGRSVTHPQATAQDQVDDLFDDAANHFPLIEQAASILRHRLEGRSGSLFGALSDYLQQVHGITVTFDRSPAFPSPRDGTSAPIPPLSMTPPTPRQRPDIDWTEDHRTLSLAPTLSAPSARFHLARVVADLEAHDAIENYVNSGTLTTDEARTRGRNALRSAFAGALLFPYDAFLQAAQSTRYDITLLQHMFQGSFEQICHRLATLRRPSGTDSAQNAVPFHFLRVDIAGTLSKPFSGSGLRFPRLSGLCPRWISHTAFLTPGQICRQVARLPDGTTYLNISRVLSREAAGFAQPTSHYSITLGCDIAFAHHLVYGDGLTDGQTTVQPVGLSCRTCPRSDCAQRNDIYFQPATTLQKAEESKTPPAP